MSLMQFQLYAKGLNTDQPALWCSLLSAYAVLICHSDNADTVQFGHLCGLIGIDAEFTGYQYWLC